MAKKIETTSKKVTAAKKTAVKKKVTKATAKKSESKALVCAPDGECFWTRDGRILQNLADLNEALDTMDEEVFSHHVNKEKNDFANWVEYVLQDSACADELRKIKKIPQAKKILAKELQRYTV